MGGKELAVWKVGALNLREVAARETLRRVRQEGHVYVELRPLTAKRSVFFCTLCLTQCFSEAVLYDHLRGNLHSKRYAAAKITLLLPNPWPFNDGVLFFTNFREKDLSLALVEKSQSSGVSVADKSCGVQTIGDEVTSMFTGNIDQDSTEVTSSLNSNALVRHKANGHDASSNHFSSKDMVKSYNGRGKISDCKGVKECLIIYDVLLNEQMTDLEVNIIGFGCIGNKIHEDCEAGSILNRIWCAWLGDGESDGCDELPAFPTCDFAIVNLSCTYDLGRRGVTDDEDRPPFVETFSNRNVIPTNKKKKSFSDPEDSSDDFIKCPSSLKHSHNTDCCSPCHSYASSSPPISCRILTKELRKQKHSNAERNCDICRQPMLPGKDVATLLNLKTGRLACSSRNINGAFHLFHASCLIHWILLCEFEMWAKQMVTSRGTRGRKRKSILKSHDFPSVFCPECQGTGICIEGDELQQPNVALSETFIYKLKAIKAHKQWMKNPEDLHKCSTGLSLSIDSESMVKLQGKMMPEKLLLFYRPSKYNLKVS